MCGFAAILAGRGAATAVDPVELARIRDSMVVRGPDGSGQWLSEDGMAGLAHRRLSIIDLSEFAAQPMESADGRLVIAFNGEIYNFRVLRAELEDEGVAFRTHSDTEVLLALYRRHGKAMLGKLRGMFAFALWDADRQGLFLARDPFGIKPLYLADDGKVLRAASQVKALLASGAVDTRPDAAGHAGFFLWGHVPEPHTLYRGIQALPAGSWLWAGADGGRETGQFFDLRGELAAAQPAPEQGSLLRAALLDSLRAHLVADVPVGMFLSGGLDSTTLTALAAEAGGSMVRTVTLGFSEFAGTNRDEVPLAEAVAKAYGTDHVTTRVTGEDFALNRDQILGSMDQPSVDGVNTWLVSRAARARGLKVALSGLGGDELFAGYDSFRQIPMMVRRLKPFARLPALGVAARMACAPWMGKVTSPKWAGLLEYGTSTGGAYLLRRGMFMPWELDRVLDSDMARQGWTELEPRLRLDGAVKGIESDRLRISALETGWYMRNQLLRDADWAGMAHSLEIRTPLVDIDLFRAVLPLAASPNGPGKRDMALCARPPLPPRILDRPKTGFFVPITEWLGETSLRGWARRVHATFCPG